MTQYYDKHVFFCTNQREDGSACCGNHDAQKARDYVKDKVGRWVCPADRTVSASIRRAAWIAAMTAR